MSSDFPPLWSQAVGRAGDLAARSVGVYDDRRDHDEKSWDFVATRGIIAVTIYALAHRHRIGVFEVELGQIVVPLLDRGSFVTLATTELAAAGHDVREVYRPDPVSRTWEWLNREWDPHAQHGERWDGMSRGIAEGLPDPAIDVCLSWAGNGVIAALADERGATLARRARVRITGGTFAEQEGTIENPAWQVASNGDAVVSGPPGAYGVRLGEEHNFRVEIVPTTHLEPIDSEPDEST